MEAAVRSLWMNSIGPIRRERVCLNTLVAFAMLAVLTMPAWAGPFGGRSVSCIDGANGSGIPASSVINGNVSVPPGSGCTLTNVVISGNVTVQSGATYLNALGTHIKGSLIDLGAASISLGTLDGTTFPGENDACPADYTFDPNNSLCEFDNLDAVGSKTTIGGDLAAQGGGDVSLDGVDIVGNLQADGVNSITTIPPVPCGTIGNYQIQILIDQTAIAVVNNIGVFSIQSLVCNGGVLQIVSDDNGLFDLLPGRPVNVGGSVKIVNTRGIPPNSLTNAICNTEIGQNLVLIGNQSSAPFVLGAAFADSAYLNGLPFSSCVPNTITGNTEMGWNSAAITGVGNVFLGNLVCDENNPAPSGSANTVVGQRQGQCQNASVFRQPRPANMPR